MEQVVVWPGSANAPGWINMHCHSKNTDPSKNDGKDWVVGWPKKTVDEFLNAVSWVHGNSQFYDTWFCTSQQRECGTNSAGKPKAVRKSKNATWLKSVWVDCDAKPKPVDWDTTHPGEPWTHYETVQEAWAALSAFRTKVGLPPPSAVVNSGGGLHVYWIADAPLAPDEWRGYAEGLKALLLSEGVKCDTGLTTDCARLLRVPGTLNHKYDPPRCVELVQLGQLYDFPTDLSALRGTATNKAAAAVPSPSLVPAIELGNFDNGPDPAFAGLTSGDCLAAGIAKYSQALLDPAPMFQQCAFLGDALATGGKDYDNPLWNLSLLCTVFMENGKDFAHKISKGHAAYDPAETQRLFERKVVEHSERGVGWPLCKTIHGAGCQSCTTCSYLGLGRSPLHLTSPVTVTVTSQGSPVLAWSEADLRVTFSNIRHRRTLYGHDLVRGEITILGSPGGVGKSSLAIGMAVSIVTGKELLGEKIRGSKLKVLLINAEDSSEEITRRVWAFCIAHGVSERELDHLYVAGADSSRVQRLSLLRTNLKGHSEVDDAGLSILREALQTFSPDVIVLDPLVALCASGNMNDNPSMSLVMRALKGLAAEFDTAVLIVHHTTKSGEAGSANAISGAAAINNLGRRTIMPVTPSAEEVTALGILPSERLLHFKLVDAKSNLAARSTDAPLYRLYGIELPNPEPPTYPFGDNVQAVVRVQPPPQASAAGPMDDQKIEEAIIDLVKRGKTIDGKVYPFSPSTAGRSNARSILDDAVTAARSATAPRQWAPGDLEAVVTTTIKKLLKDSTLVACAITGTGRFRRGQGLQVNPSSTVNGDADATDTEIAG